MGLDVHGKIIVGEKRFLKKLKVNVTKYDTDTGKPFQVDKEEKYWLTEDGVDIESFIDGKCIDVHSNDQEAFDVVGIGISSTSLRSDQDDHCEQVSIESLEKAKTTYKNITGRNAYIYNFLSYSC